MSKILVTGGCGFLGSHVCELFKEEGWEVVAYDNLTKFEYKRAFGKVEEVRNYNLRYLEGIGIPTIIDDIGNTKMLRKAMNGVNFVAHCAAQPAMTIAIEDPALDFQTNVLGTLGLLEVCREKGIPIVNCSTIHIYGNEGINSLLSEEESRMVMRDRAYAPAVKETSRLLSGIVSPLHASKRAAEVYVKAYSDTYSLPTANFRLTGIYGPRQFGGEDHGWVANFTIRTILEQSLKIFGTDKQVRDILYVKDAAKAFLDWYRGGCISGTYNIGGGQECSISIKEVLRVLKQVTGKESGVEWLDKRCGDLWWFISDYSKAKEVFGWTPEIYPKEGLVRLVGWIKDERRLF